jgi:hypothetical protein
MTILGAAFLFVVYIVGLGASLAWASSLGATYLLGLLLWTSFFGISTAISLMLFWSREHWLE